MSKPDAPVTTVDLRAAILGLEDATNELVKIPEWGDLELEIRSLSGKERAALLQDAANNGGKIDLAKMYPDLVILSSHDPATGKRVFAAADRGAVGDKNGAALERIAQVAMRLSGLSEDAVPEAKGNSSDTPNSPST